MMRSLIPFILSFSTILTLTCFWVGSQAYGQASQDTTGFHFNGSLIGARSVALANNSVSDAQSIASIYSNPAAFLFSESQTTLSANLYYNQHYNVTVENAITIPVRNDQYMLALGATIQHPGPVNFLASPHPSHLNFNQYDFSVFQAIKLGSTFSAGVGVTASYGQADEQEQWAVLSNAGFFYAPSASLSYGLSYSGVASEVINNGGKLHYYPVFNETAIGTGQAGTTMMVQEQAPHRLELGATFRFPSMSRKPDFKLSMSNEKIFDRPGLIYKAGLEYFPTEVLALRGGYFISPGISGGRLGLGLFVGRLTFDYSFAESFIDVRGNSHLISVSFEFIPSN